MLTTQSSTPDQLSSNNSPVSNFAELFSAQLSHIRKQRGFDTARSFYEYIANYYQAAKRPCPITYATYAAYENGTRQPKLEIVAQLARFLNVSLDVLLHMYDEDYVLTLLHNLNYKAYAHEAHIIIHFDSHKLIGIRKDLFLKYLHQGQLGWSQYMEHHIHALLQASLKKYSEQNLVLGDRLVASAMAVLLHIDFKQFEAQYEKHRQALRHAMIDNITNALIFYYLTNTNPLENIELVSQFLTLVDEYYTTGVFADEYIEEHYPKTLRHMFYHSDTRERIPYIDEYICGLLGLTENEPQHIKMAFFTSLFYGLDLEIIYDEQQLETQSTFITSLHYHGEPDNSAQNIISAEALNNHSLIEAAEKLGLYIPKVQEKTNK